MTAPSRAKFSGIVPTNWLSNRIRTVRICCSARRKRWARLTLQWPAARKPLERISTQVVFRSTVINNCSYPRSANPIFSCLSRVTSVIAQIVSIECGRTVQNLFAHNTNLVHYSSNSWTNHNRIENTQFNSGHGKPPVQNNRSIRHVTSNTFLTSIKPVVVSWNNVTVLFPSQHNFSGQTTPRLDLRRMGPAVMHVPTKQMAQSPMHTHGSHERYGPETDFYPKSTHYGKPTIIASTQPAERLNTLTRKVLHENEVEFAWRLSQVKNSGNFDGQDESLPSTGESLNGQTVSARTGNLKDSFQIKKSLASQEKAIASLDPSLMDRIAEDVIRRVEKRMRIDRQRRGLGG